MSSDTPQSAIDHLRYIIDEARARGEPEPNAAALATVDRATVRPSIRTVYVHLDANEPVFFVNALSGKGQQLKWHRFAALCFFWRHLSQQVALNGRVERLSETRADAVWQLRSRDTSLVARASRQEARDGDQATFATRYETEKQRFEDVQVTRPDSWVGYCLLPDRIEFWETGWQHMRMRYLYERQIDGCWATREQEP